MAKQRRSPPNRLRRTTIATTRTALRATRRGRDPGLDRPNPAADRPTSKRSRCTNAASRRFSATITEAPGLFESVLRQYPEEKRAARTRAALPEHLPAAGGATRSRAPDDRRTALRRDARDQRRPLRPGDRAPASGARRGSRQRSRALHARGRPRAARRARRSGRASRARHRPQSRKPRLAQPIPTSSRCATTTRSARRSKRRSSPVPTAAARSGREPRDNWKGGPFAMDHAHRHPGGRQGHAHEVRAAQGAAPRRRGADDRARPGDRVGAPSRSTTVVVIGHQAEALKAALAGHRPHLCGPGATTGDGARAADRRTGASRRDGTVVLLSGDVPLLSPQTLKTLVDRHDRAPPRP